jgi:ADP-ribose pyrophosphatase YjhB (NUDIX family)
MRKKISFGIIGINNKKIILIYKKYSYDFMCLVLGCYKNIKLENISEFERLILLNFKIDVIYNSYFIKKSHFNINKLKKNFENFKKKIENLYNQNFNEYLLSLKLNNKIEWEIPKGGVLKNEKGKICAIREFKEETGISYVKILNIPPLTEIFYIRGKKYINTYYIAKCGEIVNNFDKKEVSLVSSFFIDEINFLKISTKRKKIITKLFNTAFNIF